MSKYGAFEKLVEEMEMLKAVIESFPVKRAELHRLQSSMRSLVPGGIDGVNRFRDVYEYVMDLIEEVRDLRERDELAKES